jgi:ATP-binding protein involved in chromosome partitioning
MTDVTEAQIRQALKTVIDPDRAADIVSLGMVAAVTVRDGHVQLTIEVDPRRGPALEPLRQAAEKTVARLSGVISATAVLTAHREAPAPAAAPASAPAKPMLPGVRFIIAVASGKGGVGKSTTAVNLTLAFQANGQRAGILDADIYGPSLPRMMNISGRPSSKDGKTLIPMENYDVKVMSIGFMIGEDTPMIWRGPMVQGALQQMLRDVAWGDLDVLVVDMPPGTGDAQLTLAQTVPLAGAVIVSTPQDIALVDARKGLNMFRRVEVPVLGMIENMSWFSCPQCGHRTEIFSHGGARRQAEAMGVEFLGEIPLDIVIRETGDAGEPITWAEPDGPHAQEFRAIAARLWDKLSGVDRRTPPRIVIQ